MIVIRCHQLEIANFSRTYRCSYIMIENFYTPFGGKCVSTFDKGLNFCFIIRRGLKRIKPIFHQNAKYLASGTFASPNAKNSTSASPNTRIPTCWYILR